MNRAVLFGAALFAGCASNDDDGTGDESDDPQDTDPPDHTPLWYSDDDGDGYSEEDGDCNDEDELQSPGLPEICENGVDDDCDTVIDDVAAGSSTAGPSEYLEAADSPWSDIGLATFVVEDFEDQTLPEGVTASTFTWSSAFPGAEDSVDGDDGDATNGTCLGCEAMWHNAEITFTFDPVVLGGNPTHAGLVVTDSFAADVTVSLSATSTCADLGALETSITFGDGAILGETAEDRFVGFVSPAGISTLTITLGGAMEIDHLQFGW